MADKGLTALAAEIQRSLADRSVAKQGENIAMALGTIHERTHGARARIAAARRYREALRAENLTVGVLSPPDREACKSGRANVRRVSKQLLGDEGKRQSLLTSPSLQEAIAAADKAWKSIVTKANQALEAEQQRLRPDNLDQPIPELPNATSKISRLRRHQHRLTSKVGVQTDKILELAAGDEAKELLELRDAAREWATLHAELQQALAEQPPKVRRFLEAASGEAGAPLSYLTPEVADWLERTDSADRFVIRNA